jgi:hypothetical protein
MVYFRPFKIMLELDLLVAAAFNSQGQTAEVNKVYLTLLRSLLFIPVQKEESPPPGAEPFSPLFAKVDGNYFILAFDTFNRLTAWASDQWDNMGYVKLSGRDLIVGMNEQVYLCLNLGTDYYKEFSPDEIQRLKMLAARIDQLTGGSP